MKRLLLTPLIALSIACATLLGTEDNSNQPVERRHYGKKGHPKGDHRGGMHYRKSGGKYQRIVEEELDPQRKAMNQQMRDIQQNLRKNMQIFGAERRQIKNLNSLDAKKKSKEIISTACEEIKEGINRFQSQISNTIDSIE